MKRLKNHVVSMKGVRKETFVILPITRIDSHNFRTIAINICIINYVEQAKQHTVRC